MGEVTQQQKKSVVVSGIQLNEDLEKKGEKLGFNVQRSALRMRVKFWQWSRLRTPDTAMRPS